MKKFLVLAVCAIGAVLFTTACNSTRFTQSRVDSGVTNTVTVSNLRWFWNNEGYSVVLSNNSASLTSAKTGTDTATLSAVVSAAVNAAK
jgi:hypothetical protein